MNKRLFVGATWMVLCVGHAAASETALVGGKSARLSDRSGSSNDKAVVRFTQDPQLFTLEDPCAAPASLRVTTSSQDSGVIPLPCANWKRVRSSFKYTGPVGSAGGVFRITYKSGKLIMKLKGPQYATLTGPVSYVEARFRVGSTRYCGRFQTFTKNQANAVVAKGPSGACQPICGDGFIDAPEQCDDGNRTNGDCCSSTCQYETGACDDGNRCTTGDTCVNGVCTAAPIAPWINEFDYDDFFGILDDRDEFLEIAAPAGTDLGGYKVLAVEGNLNGNTDPNGSPCLTDFPATATTGNAYFIAVIPPGTVVPNSTGTGIGFLVACFTNTSTEHESAGDCDIVLPAPSTGSNLKNGYLTNNNQTDCPDGVLLLDPLDNLVDALSYEGQVPNQGLFGHYFQTPSYNVGMDQGFVQRVSLEKTTSTLSRALSGAEWHLSGGCTLASPDEAPRVTTLVGGISASDTTLVIANATPGPVLIPAFPNSGVVHIDAEQIAYSSRVDTTLSGLTRGVNGTIQAPHVDGATVSLETGCRDHSDSPRRVNPGQMLSCFQACGNGTVDTAAGEQCDPAAMPSGCAAGEGCLPAGSPGECTCEPLCGNGTLDPGEACDPLTASTCAAGQPCNSDCTCPPPPACAMVQSYTRPANSLDLCAAVFGPCAPPVPPSLTPATYQVTFDVCFRAPDAAGRVAMIIDDATYVSDAELVPPGSVSPVMLTQRFCQTAPSTGTLFTSAGSDSYPAKRCLSGDPATLLRSCTQNSDCDGPAPTAGNGVCGTRDVDYTSLTTGAGIVYTMGDGVPDPPGSLFVIQYLDAQEVIGVDARCMGDGVNPDCVLCDMVTPVPVGRVGVDRTIAAGTGNLLLPLVNRWSTGNVQNLVMQSGNLINGRQVSGAGAIRDAFAPGQYEVAAAYAKLNIATSFGVAANVQFLDKNLWVPAP